MALPPDVPVVIVVVHLVALVTLLAHTVRVNRQRLLLIRQNRLDGQEPL